MLAVDTAGVDMVDFTDLPMVTDMVDSTDRPMATDMLDTQDGDTDLMCLLLHLPPKLKSKQQRSKVTPRLRTQSLKPSEEANSSLNPLMLREL